MRLDYPRFDPVNKSTQKKTRKVQSPRSFFDIRRRKQP